MSKKDDIQSNVDNLLSGFIAPQPTEVKDINKIDRGDVDNKARAKQDKVISDIEIKSTKVLSDLNNVIDKLKVNGKNKKDNYTITFKIDADIDDYLKNIDKITFIETAKSGKINSKTKTQFINDLIREQMYKLLDVKSTDDADTINKKWLNYKNKNNI